VAVEPGDLADQILGTPGIEGATFSGGEPFCQAESVARCAGMLKEQGLNTVTFTGYTYDHIRKKGRKSWDALLGVTDLLIAGPYIQELHCPEPLRSSRNQELVHISGLLAGRVDEYRIDGQPVEYSILPGGEVTITGFPEKRMPAGSVHKEGDPCLISRG
jgi:anaerobic ribonucleoside-triphosphate reductase activating protein